MENGGAHRETALARNATHCGAPRPRLHAFWFFICAHLRHLRILLPSGLSALIKFRGYLRRKRLHFRYLVGKLAFRLRHLRRELAKPSYCNRRLHGLTLKFHGMELGILRQYAPRPLRPLRLTVSYSRTTRLPTIAIVTPSHNQSGLICHTLESVLGQDYPHWSMVSWMADPQIRDGLGSYSSLHRMWSAVRQSALFPRGFPRSRSTENQYPPERRRRD
jgi:hypothetical protein